MTNAQKKETLDILFAHASRYPQMQPTDAVKLLYQNEFGGGHLVKDPAWSLSYIINEFAQTLHDKAHPLAEPIGNGMVRLHFQALEESILPLPVLNQIFVESSRQHTGNLNSFIEKLKLLQEHFVELPYSFSKEELQSYLSAYAAKGYPMVSHSEVFHTAYAPAYRVIMASLLEEYDPSLLLKS